MGVERVSREGRKGDRRHGCQRLEPMEFSHAFKIIFLCRLIGSEPCTSNETMAVLTRGLPDEPDPVWPSADLQRVEQELQCEFLSSRQRVRTALLKKAGIGFKTISPNWLSRLFEK